MLAIAYIATTAVVMYICVCVGTQSVVCRGIGSHVWNAASVVASYPLSSYLTLFCAGNPNVECSPTDLKQVWLALIYVYIAII